MAAEPEPPLFSGGLYFPDIHGPADAEEYSWKVELSESQELKLINDQRAEVLFEGVRPTSIIHAQPAHDANGTPVPTSIDVSDGDMLTLIVHHRAGDPDAEGAEFDYPISPGEGFEVGFSTVTVVFPPELLAPPQEEVEPCRVPRLRGRSLPALGSRLREAGCALGKVRGEKSKTARVVKQYVAAGTVLPAGAKVSVKLG